MTECQTIRQRFEQSCKKVYDELYDVESRVEDVVNAVCELEELVDEIIPESKPTHAGARLIVALRNVVLRLKDENYGYEEAKKDFNDAFLNLPIPNVDAILIKD